MENKGLPRESRWGENDDGKGFIMRWFELRFRVKITKQDRDLGMSLLQTRTINKDLNTRFQQERKKTEVLAIEKCSGLWLPLPYIQNVFQWGRAWGAGWELRKYNILGSLKRWTQALHLSEKLIQWVTETQNTPQTTFWSFLRLCFGLREHIHLC